MAIAIGSTTTTRADPALNQDAFRLLSREADGCCAVIVADGVGSWERSGEAANAAVDAATTALQERGASATSTAVATAATAVSALDDVGATTLIVAAVDDKGTLRCSYIGNGALLEISTSGGPCPFWVNHLMPHVAYGDGAERLSRILGSEGLRGLRPSEIVISPVRPSVFMVLTDGISSRESQGSARTADGRMWEAIDAPLSRTIDLGATLLGRIDGGAHELQDCVDQHVELLRADAIIDDDATLAAIVLDPCRST